jgi:site-specific recombinase XerD
MAQPLAHIVPTPTDRGLVLSLGGDDPRRTREIIMAMYAYLIDKPINTRRTYRQGIRQFLDLTRWRDVRQISLADAAHYKQWLINQNYSKSTICTRLAAVDGFFGYLARKQILTQNPFDLVTRKDVLPTPVPCVPVEDDDFQKMLDALPTDPIGMRDRAVLIFLAYTGRRRSEAAALRIADLNINTSPRTYRVTMRDGQEKTFELPDEVYQAMRSHWLSSQRLKDLGPDSAVFGEAKPCPMAAGMNPERVLHHDLIWQIVNRAAVRAGLEPSKIKIHGLRHMAARDLGKSGARLRDVQAFLGHAWPSAAQRYLGQLREPPAVLRDALRSVRRAAAQSAEPIVDVA